MTRPLFDLGPPDPQPEEQAPLPQGTPRLRMPQREQRTIHFFSLNELLPPDHEARIVWSAVQQLDLSRWLIEIKAVERQAGRNANSPAMMVALWVYATLNGVGSARELARLCEDHLAYRWLCGDLSMNHHTLGDFRTNNAEGWNELLTQIVGSLMHANLVTMQRVAQDGMRVEASAGLSSFHRQSTLERSLAEAREQVEAVAKLAEENPHELSKRQQAARKRAARERKERIERAMIHCTAVQNEREARAKTTNVPAKEARASTTDPEARVMKFPNGGFAPGFNVQFGTDVASGIIVGVDVTNSGSDAEQLVPMLDQLETRYEKTPEEVLVDGGFATKEAVEEADRRECKVFAPVKDEAKQRESGKNPFEKKKGDSSAVAAWRERMGTELAKKIYKLRAQTAEWVNMQARAFGFYSSPLRGLAKTTTVAVQMAITHNLLQGAKLRAAVVGG
jgi:transposase